MKGFGAVNIIDPDAIARDELAGNTLQSAREALRRRQSALRTGRTHLVEATLAGSGIFRHIAAARDAGYRIVLHYVSVNSPMVALNRIRNRVALGGHDVPVTDVLRRFKRSHANLPTAIALSDAAALYDNSNFDEPHMEVLIHENQARWVSETAPKWMTETLA